MSIFNINSKKTNVYCVFSTNNFLCELIHSINYNKDNDNYLIIHSWMFNAHKEWKKLIGYGFFKNIIFVNPKQIEGETFKEYENNITIFYDLIFEQLGLNCHEIDNFYLTFFDIALEVYLCKNGINFNCFAEGQIDTLDGFKRVVYESENLIPGFGKKLLQKYNLDSLNCPNMISYYIKWQGNLNDKPEKVFDFNLINELNKVNADDVKALIDYYKVSVNQLHSGKNILFTQWYRLQDGKPWCSNDVVLLYGKMLDYFVEGSVLVKTHPADPCAKMYKKLLKNITVIEEVFPAELINVAFDGKYDTALTVSSSSVETCSAKAEKTLKTGLNFIYCYNKTDAYYFALNLAMPFINEQTQINMYGADLVIWSMFMHNALNLDKEVKWFSLDGVEDNAINIIDNIYQNGNDRDSMLFKRMINANDDEVFVLLNYCKRFWMFNKGFAEIADQLIPVCIKKTNMDKTLDFGNGEEYIFFYTKNKDRQIYLKNINISRFQPHCNLIVEVKSVSLESVKIKWIEEKLWDLEGR